MISARTLSVATCVLVLAVLGAGCKPKAGAACKLEAKEVCTDKAAGLVCLAGKWEPVTCRGAKGCFQNGNDAECDQSVASDKETCSAAGDHACTEDKKSVLACKQGKWSTAAACRGPKGCVREGGKADCDNSIAQVGDACTKDDDHACAVDAKASLVCKGGAFALATPCKGPKGCTVSPGTVHCDDTVADIGEPCIQKPGRDHLACASDGKQMLKCDGGKFALLTKCQGTSICKVLPEGISCGANP